jgi:hypothetical protein
MAVISTTPLSRVLVLLVTLCLPGSGCDRSGTSPSPLPTTFLTFTSSPGDWVGQGQTRRFESGPNAEFGGDVWADFNNLADNNYLSLSIELAGTGSRFWGLQMRAPRGQVLVPGVYRNAKRVPAIGSTDPQLDLAGEGRSCNTSTGEFEVFEAVYGPKPPGSGTTGTIERFHARFTQVCDGSSAGLTGEVHLVSIQRGCRMTGNC